jgi:ATP-dependent Clp protease protease subunit
MKNNTTPKFTHKPIPYSDIETAVAALPARARTVRYVGSVTRVMNERIISQIEKLLAKSETEEVAMFITSPGGASGAAMSFYDTVRHMLKPKLVTIGSGEVDSSGIIIFLSGTRRFVTKRTTFLFHPAGRMFGSQRYTTNEMAAMLEEDRLKDRHYASVVSENSKGKLTVEDVLLMMEQHTVLSAEDFCAAGLADEILP